MFKKILFILLVAVIVQLTSCSEFRRVQKSTDNNLKYEKAIEFYKKQDFYKALQLFDEVIPSLRGTKDAEQAHYYYAYCYYGQENYILAGYHFKHFVRVFPSSDHAEECMYMNAYCKYLDSPAYSLDQTSTFDAIKELQLFVNFYPKSERVELCNELIDELRAKLQKKDFEISYLYYKTSNYQAAITSFKNIVKEYPDTKYKQKILYYIIKSNYYFAYNSIESKLVERYIETIKAYNDFITVFPESEYAVEVEEYYNYAKKEIERLDNK